MRKLKSILFFSLCSIATIISISALIFIISIVFLKGVAAIHVGFLTQEMVEGGQKGGIIYQICGTMILMAAAMIISFPISLCASVYYTEFLKPTLKRSTIVLIYALNGVPAILFGLFGYIIFGIYFGWGTSWLTGSFVLAIMVLPILFINITRAIESIPVKYRQSALALGFTKWQLIHSVLIPQSFFGIVTGLLLGLSRIVGVTSAIMFTATTFSGGRIPLTFREPVATLQTHIMILSQETVNPLSRTNAWGATLVLLTIVLIFHGASMYVRMKTSSEV